MEPPKNQGAGGARRSWRGAVVSCKLFSSLLEFHTSSRQRLTQGDLGAQSYGTCRGKSPGGRPGCRTRSFVSLSFGHPEVPCRFDLGIFGEPDKGGHF